MGTLVSNPDAESPWSVSKSPKERVLVYLSMAWNNPLINHVPQGFNEALLRENNGE